MNLRFVWTDGDNKDFSYFYDITEEYYDLRVKRYSSKDTV